MIWLWAFIGVLIMMIAVLLVKIHLLRRGAKEIEHAFVDRLITDTNTLIDISSCDRYMRSLANTINVQLRKLRAERHRFQQGDMELKSAVTNVSHDLRTPLTAICGYLDLLEQEELSWEVSRYIQVIRNRAEVMIQLTEELFQYAVILSNEKDAVREPVVVNHILEESIAGFYATLSERKITPNIQMPEDKVIRTLECSALARVFANLLNNAVKYSEGDLDITLTESGEITFTNTVSELNEVQVGRLFDRFYTVEAARKSTGLGLAIARTLVEQMDGTIFATYENNKLRICILLPDV